MNSSSVEAVHFDWIRIFTSKPIRSQHFENYQLYLCHVYQALIEADRNTRSQDSYVMVTVPI